MKTAMLLQTLENQLNRLRQRCAPLAHHTTLSARFDRHLFHTRSTLLQACWMKLTIILLPYVAPLSSNNYHKSPGLRNTLPHS